MSALRRGSSTPDVVGGADGGGGGIKTLSSCFKDDKDDAAAQDEEDEEAEEADTNSGGSTKTGSELGTPSSFAVGLVAAEATEVARIGSIFRRFVSEDAKQSVGSKSIENLTGKKQKKQKNKP